LIGVDDDGGHLLLASVDGARFRVPLDESLRAAARRDRPRLGQLQIEIEGGMRPRDVQAMVRAGMTAEEVAERSGWTVEKVHKYEGPILAEREYVAGLGRAVRLRQRAGSGPSTTLGQRVVDRLAARGVDTDTIEWDAWRREGPEWTVAVAFAAGGRSRQGTWAFDVVARSLHAKDDEARWLSEDEPAATPTPREAPVYDVEADGGLDAARRRTRAEDPVDLVTAMRERSAARSRRGTARRRGLEPVAALPLDEAVPSPTTGPAEDVETIAAAQSTAQPDADPVLDPGSDPVPDPGSDPVLEPDPDPVAEPVPGPAVSAVAAEPHGEPEPLVESDDDPEPDIKVEAEDPVEAESPPARHTPRRSGRPSVPSWDDIVFGTKPKDPQP
jgi:hypothetical protein